MSHYNTSFKKIVEQRAFWKGFEGESDRLFMYSLVLLSKVYLEDEYPESGSTMNFVRAMLEREVFPPVLVVKIKGRFRVVDGKHRVVAAKQIGYTHIPA